MANAASNDELQVKCDDGLLVQLAELIECEDVSVEGISAALIEIVKEHKKLSEDMQAIVEAVGCEPEHIVEKVEEAVEAASDVDAMEEMVDQIQDGLGLSDLSMRLIRESQDPLGTLRREMRAGPVPIAPIMRKTDPCRDVMSRLVAGLFEKPSAPASPPPGQATLRSV